jgi:hypothetical protein
LKCVSGDRHIDLNFALLLLIALKRDVSSAPLSHATTSENFRVRHIELWDLART